MKFKKLAFIIITLLSFFIFSDDVWAGEKPKTDSGDTAWLLVSTAMVMLMTPGLALFYAGMSRRKNILNTLMLSYIMLCIIGLQWVLWGYSLSFGSDRGGIIGGLDFIGLSGVGLDPNEGSTIPHMLFMMFQGMFAIITPALITGALVERAKFSTLLVFSLLWATFVYNPLCHWVWGGGWLATLGALDFAGGIVVHISSGAAALVGAIVIGKRKGYKKDVMMPNNLPLTVLGAGLLWFGWFGFNAGSALKADGLATLAFVTTNTAAAAGTLAWVLIEWIHREKPTILGAVSGTIAGLGSITPAAGFVGPGASIIIGLVGGGLCYWAVSVLKPKLGYDDSLDVFGIHGIAGTWGTLATGLFASVGATGLFFGNPSQLWKQFIAVVVTWIFVLVMTFAILALLKGMGLRVSEEDEVNGLDLASHGENAYSH